MKASGAITVATFAATLSCANGTGAPGVMSAMWNGSHYDGTFSFHGSVGTIRLYRLVQ